MQTRTSKVQDPLQREGNVRPAAALAVVQRELPAQELQREPRGLLALRVGPDVVSNHLQSGPRGLQTACS